MAESRYEQIVAAVVGEIGAIRQDGGLTYWYDFGGDENHRTIRTFGLFGALFDATVAFFCAVIPDDSAKRRDMNKTHFAEARFDIVAALRFEGGDDPFSPPTPTRQTVQSRLAQDAERKLMADPALNAYRGLEVTDLKVISEDRGADTTFDAEWAIVILRVAITYRYRPTAP